MDVLVDVGAVGGGKVLLLVDKKQVGRHETRAVFHRLAVDFHQEVDFFFDRNFEGIFGQRRFPGHLAHALLRGQNHGFGLNFRIGFGDGHGGFGALGDAVGRHVAGGRKAPGTTGNHAHPDAVRLGVGDVLHLHLAGKQKLLQVPANADVGVSRALALGGVEGNISHPLLGGDIGGGFQELGSIDFAAHD